MTTRKARENTAVSSPGRGPVAIQCDGVSKTYNLYGSPREMLLDQLGLRRLKFWGPTRRPQEFDALENIRLAVHHGERVGVIGRNGAGKTTLLKLIAGAAQPSKGHITLKGNVQALMRIGLGFHPDFTGIENIRASLLYSGLTRKEQRSAEEEIIGFVELGDFLTQPLKTYSLGMKSRLQFACATAIKPDILVIDEILGAGDAYFSAKSADRMRELTGSGCTLILVSHSMGQVLQFCDRVIWLEEGRIEADGKARDVVKRYEKFIYELRKRTKLTEVEKLDFSRTSAWQKRKVREAFTASLKRDGAPDPSDRWDVEDSPIEIVGTTLLDRNETETSLFQVGDTLIIRITIRAVRAGRFPCRFSVVIFSSDGRVLTRPCSDWHQFQLAEGETRTAQMIYEPLMLGSGEYSLSCAVYERLDLQKPSEAKWYDLLARAFEFKVAEDDTDSVSLVHHPVEWSLVNTHEKAGIPS